MTSIIPSGQVRPPNVQEFLRMEICGQKLEHCYLLEGDTVLLSLEIPSCTLVEEESSKLYNLELQSFYYF